MLFKNTEAENGKRLITKTENQPQGVAFLLVFEWKCRNPPHASSGLSQAEAVQRGIQVRMINLLVMLQKQLYSYISVQLLTSGQISQLLLVQDQLGILQYLDPFFTIKKYPSLTLFSQ
jgi:hypothetical protein